MEVSLEINFNIVVSYNMSTEKVSDAQKIELLYNKALGKATTGVGGGFEALNPASAAPKIIPSLQIFSDPIPSVAPSILLTETDGYSQDMTFSQTVNPSAVQTATGLICKRWTSTKYPHIVKYENLQLVQEQFQESYKGTIGGVNYLSQTIPFNYDPAGSYGIVVKTHLAGTGFLNRARDDATIPWYYDKDAGFITFYGANRATNLLINPIMTFWRYEGGFGLGSSGSGGTGATGAVGPQGIAGKDGKDGTGGGGGGIYANDAWLTENLIGQPPAVVFGTPVSKSTAVYIPWSYPEQRQVGWAENLWLPNITKFTGTVASGATGATGKSYKVAENSTNVGWIRNNVTSSKPATVLKINKNSSIANGFVEISYPLDQTTTKRWAYNYYDASLSEALTTNTMNSLNAFYSNPSNVVPNNSGIVSFDKFSAGGKPNAPTFINGTSGGPFQISTQWDRTAAPDITNPGEGSILSYDISYNTIGSSNRYGGPIGQTGSISATSSNTSPATLTNLYPDAPYDIYVAAINDSYQRGEYTGPATVSTGSLPEPLAPVSTIALDTGTSAAYYADPATIFRVIDQANPLGTRNLYKSAAITTLSVDAPIHRLAHRGLLAPDNSAIVGVLDGVTGTIMKMSAILDGVTGPNMYFKSFPAPTVTPVREVNGTGLVEISTTGVADCSTTLSQQGFYLKASGMAVKINTATLPPSNTAHTLQVHQNFSVGSPSISNSVSFYYENTTTAVPTSIIDTVTASPLKKVSGIAILTTGSAITITSTATNMGTYFYRSPLASYFINNDSTPRTSETNLSNITAGKESDKFTNGTITFSNTFNSNVTAYGTEIVLKMKSFNIHGESVVNPNVSTKTLFAITDGPSNDLVYSTLAQTLPTLTIVNSGPKAGIDGVPAAGYRILSGADLTLPSSFTAYDNAIRLTEAPYTTELLISNGKFLTPTGTTAYTSYTTSLGNELVDYGATPISNTGYRYASFCWKLTDSLTAYKSLSFTINSINVASNTGNLLQINGEQLEIWYAIKDPVNTSYSAGTMNTVWINANSNDNPAGAGNYWDTTKNGLLGGSASPGAVLSGANATVNAFMPLVSPVNANTMLYLRIRVPMSKNIQFGAVIATVGK